MTYERSVAVEFSFPTLQGLNGYISRAPPPEDPPFFEIYGIALPVSKKKNLFAAFMD